MRSSEAINSVYTIGKNLAETAFSPWLRGIDYLSETATSGEARSGRKMVERMFGDDGKGVTKFTIGEGDKQMTLNGARIGAGMASLGIGYRALSGGGLYRDKDGNTDIAGIPFV